MPSKFKKAIAAVKDQTSISLAKVGGTESSSLEVAILKATTHDEGPIDERHVTEVLQHVSSNKSYARSCARAIGKRIGRTRNWVVAVKSLMLVLRIFQDGDPHFPKEVLHAMKRRYKILNLTSFQDVSTRSCPWDFTAFVRTFALYLDERLDCFLTGKLQRRTSHQQSGKTRGYPRKNVPFVRDMKPSVLLDRITHWQRLIDRAIASQPTGAAKTNRLVQTCLYAIVQETFELYRDISDGLSILIDGFFHLQYNNCCNAFQTCVKASKQFEELATFHELCKSIGVGRTSEYPTVDKISSELIETLQEFLKDQFSFPVTNGSTLGISTSLPPLSPNEFDPRSVTLSDMGSMTRSTSEFGGSQSTSLEDLISTDPRFSPDRYTDPGKENPPQCEDETSSVRSDPTDHRGISSVMDLLSLDGPSPPPVLHDSGFEIVSKDESTSLSTDAGWELDLFDYSNQPTPEPGNSSPLDLENNYSNPFLEDLNGVSVSNPIQEDLFGSFGNSSFAESSFPGDLGLFLGSSNSLNGMDDFSSGFTSDLGIDCGNSTPPAFNVDFGDGLGTSYFPTDFDSGNSNSQQNLAIDLFSEFPSLGNDSFSSQNVPSTFSADLGNGNANANAMNAIVLFGEESNVDLFKFQATPTFRTNSFDADQEGDSLGVENDPFGSVPSMTAVEQQKQLWLQNQNKILARHLT